MKNIEILYKNKKYIIRYKLLLFYHIIYECDFKYQLFNWVDNNKCFYNIKWININPPYEKYTEDTVLSLNLSKYYYNLNIALDIADCTYVLDDSDNGYTLIYKPYLSFNIEFRKTHCIPCWSNKTWNKLLNESKKYKEKKDNEKIVDNILFSNKTEMDEWINLHPQVTIIDIKLPTPWSSYYEIICIGKNKDILF